MSTKDSFKIPAGQDATAWTGLAVYESAVGEASPVSDPDGQIPLGVVDEVDLRSGYLTVTLNGWTHVVAGEDIDLSAQLAVNGRYAGAAAGGKTVAPVTGTYILGRFGAKATPTEDELVPFFVEITRNVFPELD